MYKEEIQAEADSSNGTKQNRNPLMEALQPPFTSNQLTSMEIGNPLWKRLLDFVR
ncbi:hypothetical protein Hanom_Chr12g01139001 [Helianthus anomalus]